MDLILSPPEPRVNAKMPHGSCLTYPYSTATGTFLEILPGYDPTVCLARCQALPHCAGFVYSHFPSFCSLKSHMSPPQYSADTTLWMRCDNLNSDSPAMRGTNSDSSAHHSPSLSFTSTWDLVGYQCWRNNRAPLRAVTSLEEDYRWFYFKVFRHSS